MWRDAEALLFVDDEQAEIVKLDVLGKQAVGADDDVHFAGFQIRQDFFLLRGAAEAAEHLDAHGKRREAALEGFEMLEGENGGGREHGDLFAVADRLESGAHGDFGFAVADVAAEEAVHRVRRSPCRALMSAMAVVLVVAFLRTRRRLRTRAANCPSGEKAKPCAILRWA